MRKFLTATFAAAIMLMTVIPAMAQKGEMKLGPTLSYGSEIKSLGIGVKFHYGLTDEIRLAPAFTYFLPKTEFDYKTTIWNLDLDGNYTFMEKDNMGIHGLAGLNITGWKFSYDGDEDIPAGYEALYEFSETKIGVNLGAGMTYSFTEKMHLLLEAKYVLSDYDEFVLSAGLMFNL